MDILSDRVHTFVQTMLERHGERVHKVASDAGFISPNRNGCKGIGGCIFCNNKSFAPGTRATPSRSPYRVFFRVGMLPALACNCDCR